MTRPGPVLVIRALAGSAPPAPCLCCLSSYPSHLQAAVRHIKVSGDSSIASRASRPEHPVVHPAGPAPQSGCGAGPCIHTAHSTTARQAAQPVPGCGAAPAATAPAEHAASGRIQGEGGTRSVDALQQGMVAGHALWLHQLSAPQCQTVQ